MMAGVSLCKEQPNLVCRSCKWTCCNQFWFFFLFCVVTCVLCYHCAESTAWVGKTTLFSFWQAPEVPLWKGVVYSRTVSLESLSKAIWHFFPWQLTTVVQKGSYALWEPSRLSRFPWQRAPPRIARWDLGVVCSPAMPLGEPLSARNACSKVYRQIASPPKFDTPGLCWHYHIMCQLLQLCSNKLGNQSCRIAARVCKLPW